MNKKRLKVFLATATISVASIFVAIGIVRARRSQFLVQQPKAVASQPSPQADHKPAARSARVIDDSLWHQQMNLNALTHQSDIIVIGIPIANACKRDGGSISTEYQVNVQEAFKGNATQGSTITVILPGGVLGFANGAPTEEVRPLGFRNMLPRRKYALFLRQRPNTAVLAPINGPQGLFELPTNGLRVIHYGRSLRLPPPGRDQGLTVEQFTADLRAAIR